MHDTSTKPVKEVEIAVEKRKNLSYLAFLHNSLFVGGPARKTDSCRTSDNK